MGSPITAVAISDNTFLSNADLWDDELVQINCFERNRQLYHKLGCIYTLITGKLNHKHTKHAERVNEDGAVLKLLHLEV